MAAVSFAVAPVAATLCTIDEVPAATLLVPYFEVDTSDAACATPGVGASTRVVITNTDDRSHIAHVTLWSDWSVPVLTWDIYLTGYDVQEIDLGDMICNGGITQTGVGSGLSPVGPLSADHELFPSCNNSSTPGDGPFYSSPFSPVLIDQLKTWLTGQPGAATGDCAGRDRGDSIARGYLTIDVARDCSLFFPDDIGYYTEVIGYDNVLLGEVSYLGAGGNDLGRIGAVHLEADPSFFGTGDRSHTFYGRYTVPFGQAGVDGREPLPTAMSARYDTLSAGATDLVTWREPGGPISAVACGFEPAELPTLLPSATVFDEMESAVVVTAPVDDVVDRYVIDSDGNVPFTDGWAVFDLSDPNIEPTYGDRRAQAWITALHRGTGTVASLAAARHGTVVIAGSTGDLCNLDTMGAPSVIFSDGFESGDFAAWSDVMP